MRVKEKKANDVNNRGQGEGLIASDKAQTVRLIKIVQHFVKMVQVIRAMIHSYYEGLVAFSFPFAHLFIIYGDLLRFCIYGGEILFQRLCKLLI